MCVKREHSIGGMSTQRKQCGVLCGSDCMAEETLFTTDAALAALAHDSYRLCIPIIIERSNANSARQSTNVPYSRPP